MENKEQPDYLLGFMKETAIRAGNEIMLYFRGEFQVDRKNLEVSAIDIVTDADRSSEKLILEAISREFPTHDIITEETDTEDTGSSWKWVIDPLDGTINFAHGYPFFCVSIGVMRDGELIAGVVRDPVRDETFFASEGGAFLNGSPIRVSDADRMERSVVATGFPYDRSTSANNNLTEFSRVMPKVQGIRRAGSAAMDLAYVACGRLDGFWELKLKPWDMAAGMVLVTRAGGRISDLHGNPTGMDTPTVVATNAVIHDQLVSLLRGEA